MSSVDAMLETLVADLRGAVGPRLVGLYLYGSAVAGGFDEGVSDIDLLAVTSVRATELDLKRLDGVHGAVIERDPTWEDRLEIVYVSAGALADYATTSEGLAVVSPGEAFHLSGPVGDWLQNWYFVRRQSVALVGPPASDVIPPISEEAFLDAISRYARYLGDHVARWDRGGQVAYAVLSACRALVTTLTGMPCSKQEAAELVRRRRPEASDVIDEALAARLNRGRGAFETAADRVAAVTLVKSLVREVDAARPIAREQVVR